jgi:hypothetical protein
VDGAGGGLAGRGRVWPPDALGGGSWSLIDGV